MDDNARLLRYLKLRHLRVVLAVDGCGSVAQAADSLHVSPAAISKALAEVEQLLGVALFDRASRQMLPTEAGVEVIAYSNMAMAQLERLSDALAGHREGTRGRLRLGVRTSTIQPMLAKAFCHYQRSAAEVDIQVVEGGTTDLVEALKRGEIDFLFAYADDRFYSPELASCEVLERQRLSIVAAPTHALSARRRVTARSLQQAAWCIPAPGSRMRHHLQTALRALGAAMPDHGITTSDYGMIVNLLQTGEYIAILPESVARPLVNHRLLRLLPFKVNETIGPVLMIWSGQLALRRSAQRFQQIMLALANESGLPCQSGPT